MTTKLVALVLQCLMTGTAMAQQPQVTSLMSKDLTENPGREVLMITVEHAPGGSNAIHRHNAHAFVYVLEGSVVMQLKGGQHGHQQAERRSERQARFFHKQSPGRAAVRLTIRHDVVSL